MFNEFHFSKLCPFFCRRSPPPTSPLSLFCTFSRFALVDGRFEFCPLWRVFFFSFFPCRLLTLAFTKRPLGDEWRRRLISVSVSRHFQPCSAAIWTCASSVMIAAHPLLPPHPHPPQTPPPSSPLFRRSQQEVGLACPTTKQQIEINLCNSRAA